MLEIGNIQREVLEDCQSDNRRDLEKEMTMKIILHKAFDVYHRFMFWVLVFQLVGIILKFTELSIQRLDREV